MAVAHEVLERLREGNRRFVSGSNQKAEWRAASPQGQAPLAIVLGCSDARVPIEIVFDQGPGDLFVIRVAGNIVAPSLVGSVEFAAARFGTPLVIVLGHSQCGAVLATIDELKQPSKDPSPNLLAIVDRVRPSVEELVAAGLNHDAPNFVDEAVKANIRASVRHLRHGSAVLEERNRDHGLVVTGAEYSLETGEVEFLDEPPL